MSETLKELNRLTERASKIQQMLGSPGWQEIMVPMLVQTKKAALELFVVAKEHDDFIRTQCTVKSVDFLFGLIGVVLTDGKEAQEKLDAMKKKEPEEES